MTANEYKIVYEPVTCVSCKRQNETGVRCEIAVCTNHWCNDCLRKSSARNETPKLTLFLMTGGVALLCDKCRQDVKNNKYGSKIERL